MAIDVGAGAANYDNVHGANQTFVDDMNPANASGTLDTYETWFNLNGSGVKFGTFIAGAANKFTSRDSDTIGNVTSGSKQTFTGKNCDVETNDRIGMFYSGGQMEHNTSGGTTCYYQSGDKFGAGEVTYNAQSGRKHAMYATGTEPSSGLPLFMHYYQKIMR